MPKPRINNDKRNLEICMDYHSGNATIEELARKHDLSLSTIREVVRMQMFDAEYDAQAELWRDCQR